MEPGGPCLPLFQSSIQWIFTGKNWLKQHCSLYLQVFPVGLKYAKKCVGGRSSTPHIA